MCAVAPNFKVMEIDIDDVKWKDDIVTQPPVIKDGELLLPTGPGWGTEINEDRSRPPATPVKGAGLARFRRLPLQCRRA